MSKAGIVTTICGCCNQQISSGIESDPASLGAVLENGEWIEYIDGCDMCGGMQD